MNRISGRIERMATAQTPAHLRPEPRSRRASGLHSSLAARVFGLSTRRHSANCRGDSFKNSAGPVRLLGGAVH
jgi:hypothetical protein